jgi:hypothetical protein
MKQMSDEELKKDIDYLRNKRDLALERFSKAVRTKSLHQINLKFDQLMRIHRQFLLADDALKIWESRKK